MQSNPSNNKAFHFDSAVRIEERETRNAKREAQ